MEQCGITNALLLDEGVSSLPSGITRGNAEIPNTYDFDGGSTAMLAVDGTIVNNLLISNTSLVFSTWIQIRVSESTYIYCLGRELRNYRHFCVFYRGNTGGIDLFYQRQYRPGVDAEEREISQSVRVAFNPTPETVFTTNRGWHFYQLRLTYRPDGDITLEMFIDGIVMQAFIVRYRDAAGNTIDAPIPDPSIVTLPFRPEPVSTEATDMVAFIGGRYNKPTLNLNGRLGRVLIFPYLINTTSLNCYTSCNELLFISGAISTAITTSYNGVNRALSFNGAAPLTDYITLLQQIAFSTSNPVSGTKRYVRLQVSSHIINTDSGLIIRVGIGRSFI